MSKLFTINLGGMQFSASLGIHEFEKNIKTQIVVDLIICVNSDASSIDETVDYDSVILTLSNVVHSKHFDLIERLVSEIGDTLIASFSQIQNLEVKVQKCIKAEFMREISVSRLFERKNS
jgi:dihydroneopterin aldolase